MDLRIWLEAPMEVVRHGRLRKSCTADHYDSQIWPCHEKYEINVFILRKFQVHHVLSELASKVRNVEDARPR